MSEFDRTLKKLAAEERRDLPDSARERVDAVLSSLPERGKTGARQMTSLYVRRIAAYAAVFVFAMLIVLPNVSSAYAETLGKVPLIGDFVRVVTVRSYFLDDGGHELDVEVPMIKEKGNGAEEINRDTAELTEMLVEAFCKEVEISSPDGHGSLNITYDTVLNTERWFTLRLCISETAAGSAVTYRYYHIDRESGQQIRLGDLFEDDGWIDALEDALTRQMRAEMAADGNLTYWYEPDEAGFGGLALDGEHDFILTPDGNLMIPFDEYEIAPGYMGTPFFTVETEVFDDFLAEEYRDLFR